MKTGIIKTVADNQKWEFSGDCGDASKASFHLIVDFTIDKRGNILIADFWNGRVRRIDAKPNIVSTLAGNKESVPKEIEEAFHFHFDQKSLLDNQNRPVLYKVAGMENVTVKRDLDYKKSGDSRLKMDVYSPPNLSKTEKRPAVILIHGSSNNDLEVAP